jgi:Aromatic acid exporter family member 1
MGGRRAGSLRRRLRRSVRRLGRRVDLGRLASRRDDTAPLGLRTAKTTVAAVISWELALRLPGSQPPVLAPLTALLVTQLTLVKTITGSLQRVASVTAGVLLALGVAYLLGLHWWSVGLVIFLSLAIAQVLRLGSHRMEVPISALLVLTLGGTPGIARTRVLETLIGAGVGVVVNAVLVPPVYVRPAGEAIYELADDVARVLEGAAADLAEGWSGEDAYERLQEARELDRPAGEAREAVGQAEDSLRLNPRRRLLRDPSEEFLEAMSTLEHSIILVRGLCRSLVELDTVTGGRGPGPELRAAIRRLLGEVAGAVRTFGEQVAAASLPGPPANPAPLLRALARVRSGRDEVAKAMAGGPREEPGAWQVHGHLLANVDRLLAELDPEGQTWPGTGPPGR